MRFHDFHLAGYTVNDFGGTIVLELVYDYPDQPPETSRIKFSDVAAYHFVHTGGAIILEPTADRRVNSLSMIKTFTPQASRGFVSGGSAPSR